jgi:hypothetical protein
MPSTDIILRERNKKAISLLEEWFSTSDDLGSALWEKFDKAIKANKVTL